MAIERSWEQQGPIGFTADGGENGVVTLNSVECFKVKQRIKLSSATQPDLPLEIKKVISYTQLIVGPVRDKTHPGKPQHNILSRTDISAYTVADGASITAAEQPKKGPNRENDILTAVYEQEPTVALRNFLVDKIGNGYTNSNPLPVLPIQNLDPGTAIIHTEAGTFTDTSETQVAEYTATINNSQVEKITGEAQTFGVWRLYKDSIAPVNLRAVERTSFSVRTAKMELERPEILSTSDSLIVTFEAERYRSGILGGSADTFVRLEGIIP